MGQNLKLCLVLALLGASAPATAGVYRDNTTDPKQIGWMELGMKLVKAKLRDPDSAVFRNVYFHQGATNAPTTCGEVNSKNGFGGMAGFQRFLSAGRAEFTLMPGDMSSPAEFEKVWAALCIQNPG